MLSSFRLALAGALVAAMIPLSARAEGPAAPDEKAVIGTIVCDATKVRYELTGEDAIWAARMIVGEAGGRDDPDSEAVLLCMVNSYALRPVRDAYPTFTAFIRAYCTPLQPYLKSQGAIERHRKRGTEMVEVEPGKFQLKRHVELQERAFEKLPASARTLALRVLTGGSKLDVGNATQFCSTAVYYHDKHGKKPTKDEHEAYTLEYAKGKKWVWVKPEGTEPMRNVFFEEERFAKLDKPAVNVIAPEPVKGGKGKR